MKTVPRGLTLHTKDAEVTEVQMSLWKRILDTLIDPNIITLMLSLGALGIIVELYHPGLIFPATLGGICLIIGLLRAPGAARELGGPAADAARRGLLGS